MKLAVTKVDRHLAWMLTGLKYDQNGDKQHLSCHKLR